jgi:hypothetical protein
VLQAAASHERPAPATAIHANSLRVMAWIDQRSLGADIHTRFVPDSRTTTHRAVGKQPEVARCVTAARSTRDDHYARREKCGPRGKCISAMAELASSFIVSGAESLRTPNGEIDGHRRNEMGGAVEGGCVAIRRHGCARTNRAALACCSTSPAPPGS